MKVGKIGNHVISQIDTSFVESCQEGTCFCKGYPNENEKRALLLGPVTLKQCKMACGKKRFCFGFEYWAKKNTTNCFECGMVPGRSFTISAVSFVKWLPGNDWATVYQKNHLNITKRISNYSYVNHY